MRQITVLALFALCGCAITYSRMAPKDRGAVQREIVEGSGERYLRVSYYVTPFFRDATKKFLTPVPPEEVALLNDPTGRPVSPGKVEKILPAGTRARVLAVKFPSSLDFTEVAFTPKQFPWIVVSVEGEDPDGVFVLVMEDDTDSPSGFFANVDRFVSVHDPLRLTTGWGEEVRSAIRTKTAVANMPSEAVEMALGYPETIRVSFEGTVRREVWVYPGGRREAIVTDGKLIRVDQKKPN